MTVHHEIYLKIPTLQLAILIPLEALHRSHIHSITLLPQFVINHVFHDMSEFYLPEIYRGISDTDVLEVILGASTNIFAPLHIITQSLADDKGILKVLQIPANGFSTDFHSSNRFECIRNSLHVRTGTNRRSQ